MSIDPTVSTEGTLQAAIAGDEPAFAALTERHRRELHIHCYRMLASFDEAEDAVQETFLNAWRGRSGFDGRSHFRAWLFRAFKLDVMRTAGGVIAEITTFNADLFPAFGLEPALQAPGALSAPHTRRGR